MNFDIVYDFCAVIEKNFFVGFNNLILYSENFHAIYCDNYYILVYCLNSFVICCFDIVCSYCLNSFCFFYMRNF